MKLPALFQPAKQPGCLESETRQQLVTYVLQLRRENATYRHRAKAIEANWHAERDALYQRVIRAEVLALALQRGLLDPDAMLFVDLASVTLKPTGQLDGADEAVEKLKRSKSYFFFKECSK